MIVRLMNLGCVDGHRWYAPRRSEYVGKACGHKLNEKSKPCERKLRRL